MWRDFVRLTFHDGIFTGADKIRDNEGILFSQLGIWALISFPFWSGWFIIYIYGRRTEERLGIRIIHVHITCSCNMYLNSYYNNNIMSIILIIELNWNLCMRIWEKYWNQFCIRIFKKIFMKYYFDDFELFIKLIGDLDDSLMIVSKCL